MPDNAKDNPVGKREALLADRLRLHKGYRHTGMKIFSKGDFALVEPDGDELVSQLGKRRWRVMGDPEDGRSVELIAVETIFGWLIIHAMSPVQSKFAKEIAQTERRAR